MHFDLIYVDTTWNYSDMYAPYFICLKMATGYCNSYDSAFKKI